MTKLTILRGISGSGKSTWAEQDTEHDVVVSRDAIRLAQFGSDGPDYYSVDKDTLNTRESVVTKIQDAAIKASLEAGLDVVVDNTNTEWRFVRSIADIGYAAGAEVSVKVFDIAVEDAITNDLNRAHFGGRRVGAGIIRKQYERLSKNKNMKLIVPTPPKPYTGTPGKPKAMLVDIDGTLAHMNGRSPYDWSRVGEDSVDEVVANIAHALGDADYKYIVMSGRDSVSREVTEQWLEANDIHYDALFMRSENDNRPDNIIKAELFDKYVRDNYDVQFVLDDRQKVVDMWRAMGLKCLQVQPGDF